MADLTGFNDGPVSSQLNVTDGAGNTASANGAAITLDTTADGGGDLALSIGDASINNAEKGAVAFTASGIDGDVTSATVTFSDGVHSVTVDASAGVADLTGFNDGPVSSQLNVTDGAGNTASANGAAITLDTTAPAVTVHLANDTGSSSTDKITSDPTLTGTGDANAVVHFTVDGNAIAATAIADALGAWTFTPSWPRQRNPHGRRQRNRRRGQFRQYVAHLRSRRPADRDVWHDAPGPGGQRVLPA